VRVDRHERSQKRLCDKFSGHPIAERTVREYVQFWKLANGKARGEIFIPQAYDPGIQAQILSSQSSCPRAASLVARGVE